MMTPFMSKETPMTCLPLSSFAPRRALLRAAAAAALAGLAPAAFGQAAYPSQTLRIVVPYAAGGATDALARMVGQKLQEAWGQTVVVENRPGAGGTIGNNLVAKAGADGHTLLMGITAIIQQPSLMNNLPYDVFKDFAPVTRIAISPSMFVVPPSTPVGTLREFVALVKANPGKYNYGTYGAGTSAHIQGSLLNMQAGLDMVMVPFSGAAPLVANMVGGQLTSAFIDMGSGRSQIRNFKVLAVTGTRRLPDLPDVPTFAEQGFQSFEPYGWFGLFAPAAVPPAVMAKLAAEVNRILALPDIVARIERMGLWVGGGRPEDFAATLRADAEVYARIVREAGIKLNP